MAKFALRTFGCQMNEHDSERLAGLFVADGYTRTDVVEEADVVVLNTCCIRENADNRLYGTLGHLKSVQDANPNMVIAVGGCLAQKDGESLRERAPYVNVVFGTHNLSRAATLVRHAQEVGPIVEVLDAPEVEDGIDHAPALNAERELDYAAWVTIQTGCDNSCAFCIVPQVRGPEVSRPFATLVDEVGQLARRGVIEVTLLGQNVNSYGRDITGRSPLFATLLRSVGEVEGISRVRFTSPHPKDLRPETIAAMAEVDAVCEHLHLPLQSGSDRVLSLMRRGYKAERYLEKLAGARSAVDDLAVSTDLIVGFPGETEEDFEETLAVVAEANFDSCYTFIFSPRPGTRAAEATATFVDADVIADRFERLRAVTERSALAKHQARIGRREEIVVEGPSRKDPSTLSVRTRQNKLIHIALNGQDAPQPGSVGTALVTAAAPHHLIGTLETISAPKRKRLRLSVSAA
jgi:tRNA-2-methylthio-N6-dimethylallyladenosine synthase